MGHYRNDHGITYSLVDMGALGDPQYFWWQGVVAERGPDADGTVPADWCLRVTSLNLNDLDGEDEGQYPPVVTEIRHETVVKAIDGILADKFSGPGLSERAVTRTTLKHCQKLVDDPEYGYLSWDQWVSDELLQVIVYGEVPF